MDTYGHWGPSPSAPDGDIPTQSNLLTELVYHDDKGQSVVPSGDTQPPCVPLSGHFMDIVGGS